MIWPLPLKVPRFVGSVELTVKVKGPIGTSRASCSRRSTRSESR